MKKIFGLTLIFFFLSNCSMIPGFGSKDTIYKSEPTDTTLAVADSVFIDTLLLAQPLNTKPETTVAKPDSEVYRKFFRIDANVAEISTELVRLKRLVSEYNIVRRFEEFKREVYGLLDTEELSHEIEMNNGTVIKGSIVDESFNVVTVMTQIGELILEKKYIKDIRETTTPHANCIVVDNPKEAIQGSVHHFSGTILNNGTLRADFVRIIFTVSSDDMETVARDSVYVAGDKIKFKSGVISDTSLMPGNSGDFSISITTQDSVLGQYFTHKVRWIELN